ncbi:MAG: NAD-dependent epimerase/dehydratase family protein [Candidatus Hodarchaeota archaeon]
MSLDLEKFKEIKVVVTGSAGFIGSHLTDALLNAGAIVIGIDNLYNGLMSNLEDALKNPNFKFIQADVRDASFLIELFKDVNLVYHEAAFISVHQSIHMPEFCNDVNVTGTLNVLNAARINDVDQVIFASSAALYADDLELPKQEKMFRNPNTPYGVSKLAGEVYLTTFYKTYGLKTTPLRYFNVYGIRQRNTAYAGVMALFIENILKHGIEPTIFGDGTQTRDFVHIKDVVKANLLVAYHPNAAGEIFNVATSNPIDINSLTRLILKLTDREDLEIKYGPKRQGDILHSYADISKIRDKIGFKPDYSIEDGVSEYISQLKRKLG